MNRHCSGYEIEVEVFLNNKLVAPSITAYPYRAYIETVLNFSKDAKDSHLTSALFYKDRVGKLDVVDPLAQAANMNIGLKEHHTHTSGSKSLMKIKLLRPKDLFSLVSSEENPIYKKSGHPRTCVSCTASHRSA